MGDRSLISFDIGSNSCRCLLLDVESGEWSVASSGIRHRVAHDTGGLGRDVDTESLFSAVCDTCQRVLESSGVPAGDVIAVSAASMRFSTVLLDQEGEVLLATPNSDARALAEAYELAASEGPDLHSACGHWPAPIFTLSRLLWLGRNAPGLLERASAVASLSDWVCNRLGGSLVAERSQASGSLLMDVESGDWATALAESLGVDPRLLPEIRSAGEVIGEVSPEASRRTGLPAGIPVVAGGADTQCALLGAGAAREGDLAIVAGSTMPVQVVSEEPVFDVEGRLWTEPHVIPGLYVLESNGLSSGSVLEWTANILFPGHPRAVEALEAEASQSPPGSGGASSTFGTCVFDARDIKIPVGSVTMSQMAAPDPGTARSRACRALLEGIAFSARANAEQVEEGRGANAVRLFLCGGMSRSVLWSRMVCDVLGRKLRVSDSAETTVLGAAVCAGVGAGAFDSFAAGIESVGTGLRTIEPSGRSEDYLRVYDRWRDSCSIRVCADDALAPGLAAAILEPAPGISKHGAAFRPRIMVTAEFGDASLEALKRLGDVTYRPWRSEQRVYTGGEELSRVLDGYHVFATEIDIVDLEAFRNLPVLKAIAVCRGNPVNVDVESATAFGVPVFNTPGRNADAVADLTVAFILMLMRKIPAASSFIKEGDIEEGDTTAMGRAYMQLQGRELWRKTVGIVGMGAVGRRVARRLEAFGAAVVYFDPAASAASPAHGCASVSLERLLGDSDVVTVHARANEETEGMFDRAAFAAMKNGSFFVNTARGALVDHEALAEALESGRLAGAALDVFDVEPPGSRDRIASRDDVIATPHIGGNTVEVAAHQAQSVVEQLSQLLLGEAPSHLLNPESLEGFDWTAPARTPTSAELERLAGGKPPTIAS